VYVCVYVHTRTQCTRGTQCEPRGRDETPGGPEESSWHICIRICVQKAHVYIYAWRRDEILDKLLFFLNTLNSETSLK